MATTRSQDVFEQCAAVLADELPEMVQRHRCVIPVVPGARRGRLSCPVCALARAAEQVPSARTPSGTS